MSPFISNKVKESQEKSKLKDSLLINLIFISLYQILIIKGGTL